MEKLVVEAEVKLPAKVRKPRVPKVKKVPSVEKVEKVEIGTRIEKPSTEIKSMSVELTSPKIDELIFRLERAGTKFDRYQHKSIRLTKDYASEEFEARLIIIKDLIAMKSLALISKDVIGIALDHEIDEIAIYEILIEEFVPKWYDPVLGVFKNFFGRK
jgi:hypothetical protein